jgi:hypothetical protein
MASALTPVRQFLKLPMHMPPPSALSPQFWELGAGSWKLEEETAFLGFRRPLVSSSSPPPPPPAALW